MKAAAKIGAKCHLIVAPAAFVIRGSLAREARAPSLWLVPWADPEHLSVVVDMAVANIPVG